MSLFRVSIIFFIFINIFGCVEKTTYSGKIITEKELSNLKILNIDDLISKLGQPSYIDTIQNEYFYYTELTKGNNFYNQKKEYSYLFIFQFNKNNQIIKTKSIDLLNQENKTFINKKTQNNVLKRGLIEKIFGGVGPNQLPDSQ